LQGYGEWKKEIKNEFEYKRNYDGIGNEAPIVRNFISN
jgi:hypothetical protein